MKLFSHLLQRSQRLLRIIAILPLLAIYSPTYAEVDIDNHGSSNHNVEFSQAELDQLLAPIALYPDTVLSQILIASTYPIEVIQADRWASTNTNVKGADAVAKVDGKDWDPSVKALVAFPDILQRMSDDIDWTQKLGDAFLSDEGRVMDSVQSLRKKAYASGTLNKVQHLKVQRDDDEIIIEPAEERVVYVPVYDTRVVYGNWWWPDYPPVYWHQPASYVQVSSFYWGPSIYIGPTFFYSSVQWRERHVVVVDRYNAPGPRPVFYTGRSIVNYQGAREWHHEPIHRRGVAYYNDDLRDRYGSRHESYRDAHVYREEHREQQLPVRTPSRDGANRNDNNALQRPVTVDRSEQLRERMNNRNDNNTAGQRIDRNFNGNNLQPNARTSESEQHTRVAPPTHNTDAGQQNRLGATRPTLTAPERAQPQRIATPEASNNIRNEAPADREMHNDGRNLRQLPNERVEEKKEGRIQTTHDKADDDDKKQNRFNR